MENIIEKSNDIPPAQESIKKAQEIVKNETNKKGLDGRWYGIWSVLLDEWVQSVRKKHIYPRITADEEWFIFHTWIKEQYYLTKTPTLR